MDKYEALEILKENNTFVSDYEEAVYIMEALVDKETPIKIIHNRPRPVDVCPTCDNITNAGGDYCENCGQALDWSEYQ